MKKPAISWMRQLCKRIQQSLITGHTEWWLSYLTEISVVIVGLCITYYGDSLMNRYTERQEDAEAMQMVREELGYNLHELDKMQAYYQADILMNETFKRVESHQWKVADSDTIGKFLNQHRKSHYWSLKSNAFKMIQGSTTIQRIDKTLLTQLFECYEYMDVVTDMGNAYREKRLSELIGFSEHLPEGKNAENTLEQWKQISSDEKFDRYIRIVLPMMAKSTLSVNIYAYTLINATLNSINKNYPQE